MKELLKFPLFPLDSMNSSPYIFFLFDDLDELLDDLLVKNPQEMIYVLRISRIFSQIASLIPENQW